MELCKNPPEDSFTAHYNPHLRYNLSYFYLKPCQLWRTGSQPAIDKNLQPGASVIMFAAPVIKNGQYLPMI